MQALRAVFRLLSLSAIVVLILSACGGGSGQVGPTIEGSRQATTVNSNFTATNYGLNIYLPPASAGPRSGLPVMYVLDGESWFETLVGITESTRARLIIVAINHAGQRNRDFVPSNTCTSGGGGQAEYLKFVRQELIPHVERTLGGDPKQRILFGHSHGGSFALYAMLSEAPGQHTFGAYLASDSSLSCIAASVDAWEQAYSTANRGLPVRLHLSYATLGNYAPNLAFGARVTQRNYERLAMLAQAYTGSHSGIVPQALADGVAFALAR